MSVCLSFREKLLDVLDHRSLPSVFVDELKVFLIKALQVAVGQYKSVMYWQFEL